MPPLTGRSGGYTSEHLLCILLGTCTNSVVEDAAPAAPALGRKAESAGIKGWVDAGFYRIATKMISCARWEGVCLKREPQSLL